MPLSLDPPFGTYALQAPQEGWRKKADNYPDTYWGRLMISHYRKKALKAQNEPFDVQITPNIKARLYPYTNRCEWRAFAGVQIWDKPERLALKQAIETAGTQKFIFLDVGANIGLYSLFVADYGAIVQIPMQILAIEPSMQTCQRLEDNIAVNMANIQIIRAAISDSPGTGVLGGGEANRGEVHLIENKAEGETVVIDTLARIARVAGLTHINALKLDIEGYDYKALFGFFTDAPKRLYPDLLIVEIGYETDEALIELCRLNGYSVDKQTKTNAIFVKTKTGKWKNG